MLHSSLMIRPHFLVARRRVYPSRGRRSSDLQLLEGHGPSTAACCDCTYDSLTGHTSSTSGAWDAIGPAVDVPNRGKLFHHGLFRQSSESAGRVSSTRRVIDAARKTRRENRGTPDHVFLSRDQSQLLPRLPRLSATLPPRPSRLRRSSMSLSPACRVAVLPITKESWIPKDLGLGTY